MSGDGDAGPRVRRRRWRVAASLIDAVVFAPVLVPLTLWSFQLGERDVLLGFYGAFPLLPGVLATELLSNLMFFAFTVALMLRPGVRRGQTLGKQWVGLATVTADGSPLSTRRTLGRQALALVVFPLWGVVLLGGLLLALFDRRRRTLHDRLAGTVVIATRERTASDVQLV